MPVLNVAYNSKAIRLSQSILEDIGQGKFPPGSILPGQEELARKYNVSRATVFRAIGILSKQGQLIRHSPRGVQIPLEGGLIDGYGRSGTERKLALAVMWAAPEQDYAMVKRSEATRRYAQANGLKFSLFVTPRHDEIIDALNRIEDYKLDGVIIYPYALPGYEEALKKLLEKKFPVVLARSCGDIPLSTVMSNDSMGQYQITQYMIEKHHRPAYYIATDQGIREAPERYAGYRDAMKDAGFGPLVEEYTCRMEVLAEDDIFIGPEKTHRPHFQAVGRFLDQIRYPASILCGADAGVPDIYDNAVSRGKVVGKDLFVASFGDLPLAKFLNPSLTTIHADLEDLGIEAGRLLHRLIKNEVQPPVHIHLPVELIIRESA